MVRVAFGGISHETNTFATEALGLTTLEQFHPRTGNAVLGRGVGDGYMGGMVHQARELGYECVGLLFGVTEPSGTIADAAFESMADGIIAALKAAMPVDVVAIENHGAGVAESYEDIEGELATRIRAVIGPAVPLVGTWDLHGNISEHCVSLYDFMCPVHLYPHTDSYERGLECMAMVPRLLSGLRTTAHLEKVPTLLPLAAMCTQPGFPAAEMNEFCYELEKRPGVLDCTVFHGFPWADISIVGTSVVVTTDNDLELAKQIGREAGAWIWRNRARFGVDLARDGRARRGQDPLTALDIHSAASAVEAAKAWPEGPVCINETCVDA